MGLETTLRQTALQRHLTALETDLVVAARTGLLTFVTTAGCFTEAGADAATDTALGMLGTIGGLDCVEFHDEPVLTES
jgi:hypothetical protein